MLTVARKRKLVIEYEKSKHGSMARKSAGDIDPDGLANNNPHAASSKSSGGVSDMAGQAALVNKRSIITEYFRASLI